MVPTLNGKTNAEKQVSYMIGRILLSTRVDLIVHPFILEETRDGQTST